MSAKALRTSVDTTLEFHPNRLTVFTSIFQEVFKHEERVLGLSILREWLERAGKIGGVYSADGQIVVQHEKGRSGGRGGGGGPGCGSHGLFSNHHHHHNHNHNHNHHHHHQGQGQPFKPPPRRSSDAIRGFLDVPRAELIPRARLRHSSPQPLRKNQGDRSLRPTLSCCERRPQHIQKHVNFAVRPRDLEEVYKSRYELYAAKSKLRNGCDEFGYSSLSTPEPSPKVEEESDMEYYTSSETGSQETVRFNGIKEVELPAPQKAGPTVIKDENPLNETAVQIVVQQPENLYAEIDLKLHAQPQEKPSEETKDAKPLTPPPGTNAVMKEMEEFDAKLEEIIRTTEELCAITCREISKEQPDKVEVKENLLNESKANEKAIEKDVLNVQEKEAPIIPEKVATKKPDHGCPKTLEPNVTGKPPIPPQWPKQAKFVRSDIPRFTEKLNETTEQTFYEEEYSYEPELQQSSTKVVLRTRSLLNLDEEVNSSAQRRQSQFRNKITTGPDGTFRIGGRKASSEMNLSDDSNPNSNNTSPKALRHFSGEELKKRKEEIFKDKNPTQKDNFNRFNEEINSNTTETTKQRAINNLKRYLKENSVGLREILVNNNVVIVEPIRQKNKTDIYESPTYEGNMVVKDDGRVSGTVNVMESNQVSNTLPRAAKTNVQRHFFYHPIKSNRELKDEELPDPDKVRNARQKFQEVVKFTRTEDSIIMLPIAAKLYEPPKEKPKKPRTTPEVRVIYDKKSKEKIKRAPEPEIKQEYTKKMPPNRRWTDTGSLSSGVSSDMSCFSSQAGDNNSPKEILSSEDEDPYYEKHPVSPEVLKKIRACGTSVTYYGGRVIAHCDGPIRSPMTMTIMDEIRQTGSSEEARRDQYMGVKLRLVKSNSCGSRLELAGTEKFHEEVSRRRFHEDVLGPSKTLREELSETPSWRALIEARKATNYRRPSDMEFEEFTVLEG